MNKTHTNKTHTPATSAAQPRTRYRGVVTSVALMLSLMGAVGYYNYHESQVVSRNAEHIDVAGYASDAFYKVVLNSHYLESDIHRLQAAQRTSAAPQYLKMQEQQRIRDTLAQLRQEADDINQFLGILRNGGPFDRNAEPAVIDPLTHPGVEPALAKVENMWREYRVLIDQALAADLDSAAGQAALTRLVDYARQNQVPVYDTLDIIISDLTQENVDRNARVALVLTASALALLLFLGFFVGFIIRRLNQHDRMLAEAHRQLETSYTQVVETKTALEQSYAALDTARQASQAIMDNVATGLGLIDRDMRFNPKYSQQLETLLGTTELANRSLSDILAALAVAPEVLAALPDFVAQLFQTHVREQWIGDLNPLRNLKVVYRDRDSHRYLDIQFKRVWHKNADGSKSIIGLLTSVNDITEAVALQNGILLEKESQRLQLETLDRLTGAETGRLRRFIDALNAHNEEIQQTLQQQGYSTEFFRNKYDHLLRLIHTLEQEAASMDLAWFVGWCGYIRTQLDTIRHKPVLTGDDFVPAADTALSLAQFTCTINKLTQTQGAETAPVATSDDAISAASTLHAATQWEYTELNDEFAALIGGGDTPAAPCAPCADGGKTVSAEHDTESLLNLFAQQLPYFAQELADSLGKQAGVETCGFATADISDGETTAVQDIVIQLVRNSIIHGIETPEQRQALGKTPSGKISIRLEADADALNISVGDDGLGLDVAAIKAQAAQQGWMSREQAEALSDKELVRLIFSSGFSTATTAGAHGGDGKGLDIIRNQIYKTDPPGRLDVRNTPGQGLELVVRLPRRAA